MHVKSLKNLLAVLRLISIITVIRGGLTRFCDVHSSPGILHEHLPAPEWQSATKCLPIYASAVRMWLLILESLVISLCFFYSFNNVIWLCVLKVAACRSDMYSRWCASSGCSTRSRWGAACPSQSRKWQYRFRRVEISMIRRARMTTRKYLRIAAVGLEVFRSMIGTSTLRYFSKVIGFFLQVVRRSCY